MEGVWLGADHFLRSLAVTRAAVLQVEFGLLFGGTFARGNAYESDTWSEPHPPESDITPCSPERGHIAGNRRGLYKLERTSRVGHNRTSFDHDLVGANDRLRGSGHHNQHIDHDDLRSELWVQRRAVEAGWR